MMQEKIVASCAKNFFVIADDRSVATEMVGVMFVVFVSLHHHHYIQACSQTLKFLYPSRWIMVVSVFFRESDSCNHMSTYIHGDILAFSTRPHTSFTIRCHHVLSLLCVLTDGHQQ